MWVHNWASKLLSCEGAMEYSLQSVDHPEFSDSHWERFHRFLQAMHAQGLGNPPPPTWEALKARVMGRITIGDGFREWVLWRGDRAVGWQMVQPRGEAADGGTAFFDFNFEPGVEIDRASAAMASRLAETMGAQGYTSAHCACPDARLDGLRRAWGGQILCRIVKYRLDRTRANRYLIERWLAEFPSQFPELRLEFYTEIPEEHIATWLSLFKEFIEEMPSEGQSGAPFRMTREEVRQVEALRRQTRQYLYTAALFDGSGRMIGHSNMASHNYPPTEWHQAMTGIVRPWRGKGLSKWLKAAMFVRTGEDFPESRYIVTEMRSVNEPILAVNRAMGFEQISEGYEWSIDLEALTQVIG